MNHFDKENIRGLQDFQYALDLGHSSQRRTSLDFRSSKV
jgi:hypothetical protein